MNDSQLDSSKAPLLSEPGSQTLYGAAEIEACPPKPLSTSQEKPPLSQLFAWPFVITVVNFGLMAFTDMSVSVLVPLVWSTPIEYGGLGMDPFWIGVLLGIQGVAGALFSSLYLGDILRRYGPTNVFRTTTCIYFLIFCAFPIANALARDAGRVDAWASVVLAIQVGAMSLNAPNYGE